MLMWYDKYGIILLWSSAHKSLSPVKSQEEHETNPNGDVSYKILNHYPSKISMSSKQEKSAKMSQLRKY
jgi:hypothetical protein